MSVTPISEAISAQVKISDSEREELHNLNHELRELHQKLGVAEVNISMATKQKVSLLQALEAKQEEIQKTLQRTVKRHGLEGNFTVNLEQGTIDRRG